MTQAGAQAWFRENAAGFGGTLLFDEPLSRHTYYRIGGPALVLASPRSAEDLAWLARGIAATKVRTFVLGMGSNLLVSDEGFPGLVIRANRVNLDVSPVSEEQGRIRLRTGASVAISSLLRRASQEGWGGLEFLTGVPGSVGGAVFMNAGTHLGESGSRLRSVEAFSLTDSSLVTISGNELRFEYRRNLFLPPGALVFAAEWEVDREEAASVKARIDETLARRKSTQPIDYPSCGSVFKNPKGDHSRKGKHAWQVVDELGLRGHRIGDAQISEKHSNFIINLGNARASDVRALIDLVKSRAAAELGIQMEEEVVYLF